MQVVAIDAYSDPGLYQANDAFGTRYMVVPSDSARPAAALQLNTNDVRKAFTFVFLEDEPLAFARLVAPLAISLRKDDFIGDGASTLGAAKITEGDIVIKAVNAQGELGLIQVGRMSRRQQRKVRWTDNVWCRWAIVDPEVRQFDKVLWESHPAADQSSREND